ncbi:MAG: phosphotransferase [Pseudomonadales bacterium]
MAAALPGSFLPAQIHLHPLKAEASFRSFFRVLVSADQDAGAAQASGRVLMVSPPEKENNAQFKALIPVFLQAGVRVPALSASRDESGWFLLEDLGDRDLQHAYAGVERAPAIQAALATLARIQTIRDPLLAPYTRSRFRDELGIFREWFLQRLLQIRLPRQLEATMDVLAAQPSTQPQCCVHRDYHCRNLLYSSTGEFGVVDFQDALIGPSAYDLASLLHDCYFHFDSEEIDYWREHFRASFAPELSTALLQRNVEFCAVQRQLKAIGIFTRLHLSRTISSHLTHILPVLERLPGLCAHHAELESLGRWLAELLPAAAQVLEPYR